MCVGHIAITSSLIKIPALYGPSGQAQKRKETVQETWNQPLVYDLVSHQKHFFSFQTRTQGVVERERKKREKDRKEGREKERKDLVNFADAHWKKQHSARICRTAGRKAEKHMENGFAGFCLAEGEEIICGTNESPYAKHIHRRV